MSEDKRDHKNEFESKEGKIERNKWRKLINIIFVGITLYLLLTYNVFDYIFTFYKLVCYAKSNRRAILLNKRGGTKMTTTLELLRIVVIIGLLGGLGWVVIENIYTINEITQNYSWLGALAILILLFVLY